MIYSGSESAGIFSCSFRWQLYYYQSSCSIEVNVNVENAGQSAGADTSSRHLQQNLDKLFSSQTFSQRTGSVSQTSVKVEDL